MECETIASSALSVYRKSHYNMNGYYAIPKASPYLDKEYVKRFDIFLMSTHNLTIISYFIYVKKAIILKSGEKLFNQKLFIYACKVLK